MFKFLIQPQREMDYIDGGASLPNPKKEMIYGIKTTYSALGTHGYKIVVKKNFLGLFNCWVSYSQWTNWYPDYKSAVDRIKLNGIYNNEQVIIKKLF